jgi:hypothetical protein
MLAISNIRLGITYVLWIIFAWTLVGAQRYGIKSVHHTNWQDTERELVQQGLILCAE